MTATIRQTCCICGRFGLEPLCDDCLRRIEDTLGRSDVEYIEEDEAWAIAAGMVAADIRAERRGQARA